MFIILSKNRNISFRFNFLKRLLKKDPLFDKNVISFMLPSFQNRGHLTESLNSQTVRRENAREMKNQKGMFVYYFATNKELNEEKKNHACCIE